MNWRQEWQQLSHSRIANAVMVLVGAFLIAFLIFHAGVSWGERQAFGRIHGYSKGGTSSLFGFLPHSFIPAGHGEVGTITAIALPVFTLQTRSGEIESVLISSSTIIRGSVDMQPSDLQLQQSVVVIGDPAESTEVSGVHEQIDARLIRLVTPLPSK